MTTFIYALEPVEPPPEPVPPPGGWRKPTCSAGTGYGGHDDGTLGG